MSGYRDQLAEEQAALRRVATLVASSAKPRQVFQAVAEEAGRLLEARTAATVRFDEEAGVVVEGARQTHRCLPSRIAIRQSRG